MVAFCVVVTLVFVVWLKLARQMGDTGAELALWLFFQAGTVTMTIMVIASKPSLTAFMTVAGGCVLFLLWKPTKRVYYQHGEQLFLQRLEANDLPLIFREEKASLAHHHNGKSCKQGQECLGRAAG